MPEEAGGDRAGFLRWRYWLPGLLLATAGGLVALLLASYWASFGYGLVLAVPFAIGCALGYGVRVGKLTAALMATVLLGSLTAGGVAFGASGLLCAAILTALLFGPIVIGTLLGSVLRWRLKRTKFSQGPYLPALLFVLPISLMAVERGVGPAGDIEVVRTTRVLDAPASVVWDSIHFYEEVTHRPPWLAGLGLPRPLGTRGEANEVGDVKTCLYDKGHLRKRVTRLEPPSLLIFEVIEQVGIEDHSVRLIDGSFELAPLGPHAERTELTLTTRYAPLLAARPFWRPFEHHLTRALHDHVLTGIELEAANRQRAGADRR
jgi:hypothetical protein